MRELAQDIGAYPETDDYIAQASQGVAEELNGFDYDGTLRERDALLVKLIELKRHAKHIR
jgi:carnitine 3-dehydrogenase